MTEGKLDGLFNNGAFGQPGAVEDLTRDVLREQFETNFFGTHELTNLIIPLMREQGGGRIIYNSSVLGFIAMAYRGAYTADHEHPYCSIVNTSLVHALGFVILPLSVHDQSNLTVFFA